MFVFSGIGFIFRFFPIFLIAYYAVPARFRNTILLIGSIVFYAMGEPHFIVLLLAMTVLNYLLALIGEKTRKRLLEKQKMEQMTDEALSAIYQVSMNTRMQNGVVTRGNTRHCRADRLILALAVVLDIGLLTAAKALALTQAVPGFHLPLGMSFYVFRMVSFQADLYRGKTGSRLSFINTAAYFTMFPQVTQGPIMRYGEGGFGDPAARKINWGRFEDGAVYFVIGLAMKILLADRLGILWNELSKIGYESVSTPLAWLGLYGYSFELYYDFWGYSLMAAGIGMMLGFDFIENFRHPYAAGSVSEFYRRWHITLGSWFRDYLYIPLGGSRKNSFVTVRNLFLVWLATGLWHGGTLNFVIWGLVLGVIIILEKFPLKEWLGFLPFLGRVGVLILIPLSWGVFAISDLNRLSVFFTRLFPFFEEYGNVNPHDFVKYVSTYWPMFAAGVLLLIPGVYGFIVRKRRNPIVVILLAALFWVSVYYSSISSQNVFMYYGF